MRVFLDMVGCRLNQAELESMARQFRAAGHEIVPAPDTADLAVVNTCAVTAQAASDSRAALRRAASRGRTNVIAAGCWATLEPSRAATLSGVRRVIPNASKDTLVSDVLQVCVPSPDLGHIGRWPLPGTRRRTRAFVKVQDGCDNCCTFCATTIARGKARSRRPGEVIQEIQSALQGGSREVVLTGVHLGAWGNDLGLQLADLVKVILGNTDVSRLRLSSLEPWDLRPDFFALWQDARLCTHLHLPLQSGSSTTLRHMARRTTPASFRDLISAARDAIPGVAITTDLISGFPGETEGDFQTSLDFVRQLELAGGHAFTYSPMPGTAASRMPDQVPPNVRKLRNREYIRLLEMASRTYRRQQIGKRERVLWEASEEVAAGAWTVSGWTGNYLRVRARSTEARWNILDEVELAGEAGNDLLGIIHNEGRVSLLA